MRTVITGGKLIDPRFNRDGAFDLLIEDGVVKGIDRKGAFSSVEEKQVISAQGMLVLPGFIDLHVHLRDPGFEWRETIESGVQAAVLGGYTSICCMPNTSPVNDRQEVTRYIVDKAKRAGLAHVLPIGAVSMGLQGKELSSMTELEKSGCVAFSDDGEPVWDAGLMRRAIEWCLMSGLTIACHEEDKSLSCDGCMNESARSLRMGLKGWHKVAEEVMIARDIELARAFEGKVHFCHVSTARGVELVRRAKHDGILVTAEVTPHHLTLTEQEVEGYDTLAKMSPPLREAEDVEALIEGVRDGTIDAIASDHAPHEMDSKRKEFARASFGTLGLQTSLPVLMSLYRAGRIPLNRVIEAMTSGPAKCFNLKAGSLGAGDVADLVIVDPEKEWVFGAEANASKSQNSSYWNRPMQGSASTVLVAGRVVVKDGALVTNEKY